MTNRPIGNALISVGSLYTTRADVSGAFNLRSIAGDQTVTARAAGYSTATADATIPKDGTASIGYIRLVQLTAPAGEPTLAPPATPSPQPSPTTPAAAPASSMPPSSTPAPAAPAAVAPSPGPSGSP